MPFSETYIGFLAEANQTSTKIAGQLFTYDAQNKVFQIRQEHGAKRGFKYRSIFLLFNAVALFLRILVLKISTNTNIGMFNVQTEFNLCIMFIIICIFTAERYRVRANNPDDYVVFFNNVIKFESLNTKAANFGSRHLSRHSSNIPKYFIQGSRFIEKWIVSYTIVIAICFVDKSMPLNPLWVFDHLTGFSDCTTLGSIIFGKMFLIGYNYFLWKILTVQGYCVTVDILLGVLSVTFCQNIAYSNLIDALQEGKTLADANKDVCCFEIRMFRAVHLLVELCNKVLRSLLLLMLLATGIVHIMAAVTLILYRYSLNFLIISFFFVLVVESGLIVLVMYGLAGEFCQASELSLMQLKRQISSRFDANLGRKERKYWEKFLRSCQIQKVRFGLSNFIERTTPPIFQLFCLNRIVDLLLVSK